MWAKAMTDSVLLQAGRGDAARLQGRRGQTRQFQIPLQGPRPRVWHSERGGRRRSEITALLLLFTPASPRKYETPVIEHDMLIITVAGLHLKTPQEDMFPSQRIRWKRSSHFEFLAAPFVPYWVFLGYVNAAFWLCRYSRTEQSCLAGRGRL